MSETDRDTLVRTIYGEARGEAAEGQRAVVHVIRNRVAHRKSSPAIECRRPWQFSCWNANDPNLAQILGLRTTDPRYLAIAAVVDAAWLAADTTGGARHYYAPAAMVPRGEVPAWARGLTPSAQIGGHLFFAGVA